MKPAPLPAAQGSLAPLYSVAQVRAVEQAAMAGLAPHALMQRAAKAAADLALQLLRNEGPGDIPAYAASATGTASAMPVSGMRVLVAAGPGNNGGDAIECALLLAAQDCAVTLWMPVDTADTAADTAAAAIPAARAPGAPTLAPGLDDRARALSRLERSASDGSAIRIVRGMADADALAAAGWNLAIDGLFGIGLRRPLNAPWRSAVALLNAVAAPLLALDVPSGLDADTGCILRDAAHGSPADDAGDCVHATHTITFIGDKTGLHTGSGREMAGVVSVAALGIDAGAFPAPLAWLNTPAAFAEIHRQRRADSHKGSYGDVCIIGGATGMAGAAILAAQAALKSGCGRVTIGFAQAHGAPAFIPGQPELMCRATWPAGSAAGHDRDAADAGTGAAADAAIAAADAASTDSAEPADAVIDAMASASCVVGPGLGREPSAAMLVTLACGRARHLVLDADALNLIASSTPLQERLMKRRGPLILTPHPLEAARLLGTTAAAVQADRLQAAQTLATRHAAIVVLKGSGTIVVDGRDPAAPNIVINPTGNAALATGGTGDVLAGMCGALLAQGWDAFAAAAGAVWLHGAAADWLVDHGIGPVGVTAGEIIEAARTVRNQAMCAARPHRPDVAGKREACGQA